MTSAGDSDSPFGAGDSDETPTHNKPWPLVDPFVQGRFERKFLANGETIDFDSFPKLQFWSPWFGFSDIFRVLHVLRRVSTHSSAARRPLTGTEANALGEHTANSIRYFTWAQPVSSAIALAIAVNSRHTFSFPFYRPKMIKFDPYSFPTRRFRILTGPRAALMWHVTRYIAYLPLAWIPTSIVFNSIAENSFVAHARRDPRLTSLIQQGHQKLQNRQQQPQPWRRPGVPNPVGTVPPQNPQQTGDGAYRDGSTPQDYGSTDYSAQPSSAFGRPGAATEGPRATQPDRARSSRREDDDHHDLFEDDDASPVAPSARRQEVGKGQSTSPGSSWDRIRQQAKAGDPNWERGDSSGQGRGWAQLRQDKTRDSRDSAPKTDSYSYSTDDEEREGRNYEKEQAQKEFDALVEAERRDDSGSSNSQGWRR
ncbi:hypothetical protein F4823DRAFT_422514 [Ustulina deusta]|nr:hypothetical protein F4823DRAFT_422514 [Ustulina deusta]